MVYGFAYRRRILATDEFKAWFGGLKDRKGKAAIAARIGRIEESGNFGDAKAVGGGVREMRIPSGPGYRVYYSLRGREVVLLLVGGDKSSQARDIAKAKAMVEELRKGGLA